MSDNQITIVVGDEIEIESFGVEIPQVQLIGLGPTGDVTPEAVAARDAAQAAAEQADQSATDAASSATAAEAAQLAVENLRDQSNASALASANSAQNSEDSAAAAQASALAAANSALEASDLEAATSDLHDETETFRNESLAARNAAQTAETGAVTAHTAAEAAKIDAESAQAASETARDTSMQKAQESVLSAADALASENAAAASAADALASRQAALASENAAAGSANAAAADRQDVLVAKGQVDAAKAAVDAAKTATDQARDDAIAARDASQSARDIALQAQSDAETANAAAQQAKTDTQAIVDAVDETLFGDYVRKDANGSDFTDPATVRANLDLQVALQTVSEAEARAGQSTVERNWTAERVAQAHEDKAPLESPALTGTPTAPTAASGTNSTQIATTAFVRGAIDDLTNGAGTALDTLGELAQALGDDPNFAATVTAQIAGKSALGHHHPINEVDGLEEDLDELRQTKADLASPALTGTPTAPTPGAGDSTDKIATTNFVHDAVATSEQGTDTKLALKAPLDSPALTGAPTAPTPAPANDSALIATTAFVKGEISALGNASKKNVGMVANTVAAGDDPRFAEIGKNDSAFALALADLTGQRVGMVGGFSDSYRDTLGVHMPNGGRDVNTISLLPFNGPISGKKTVVDSAYEDFATGSPRHLWTPQGAFTVSDEQSKFGGFSGKFDGTANCRLLGDGSSEFALGTGDFTVECWFYRNGPNTYGSLFDFRTAATSVAPYVYYTRASGVLTYYVSGAARITTTTNLAENTWHHVALVRQGGQTKLFVNGVQEGITYVDANNYVVHANGPSLGGDLTGAVANQHGGFIDEFRVSKVARWFDTFVPPTAPYDNGTSTTKAALYDAAGFQWYSRELKRLIMFMGGTRANTAAVATLRTDRTIVSASLLRQSAGRIRIRFRAPISGTPRQISDVFIGHKADTGNAWDIDPATIRRVTWGGANALNMVALGTYWSDWIEFPLDNTRDVVVSHQGPAVSGIYEQASLGVGLMTSYYKASNEAGDPVVAGMTALAAGAWWFLDAIEGKDSAAVYDDMWVESTPVIATTPPSKVRLVLQIAGDAVLTPNSDFVGEVSRDGGTTWTPVTLALSSQLANYRTYAGIADVSGQPSGTSMKYRVRNPGGKLAILSGAVQQWGNV